jgi:hypothetical protein
LNPFSIAASYPVAAEIFRRIFPSLKKVSIFSDLPKPESPGAIRHLLEVVAEACPHLEALILSYSCQQLELPSEFPAPDCLVHMEHLRPILICSRIRKFSFEHPFPVTLQDHLAKDIATSWPDLQELYLNPEPLIQQRTFEDRFTLGVLLLFVRHCPRLRCLALLFAVQSSTCPSQGIIRALAVPSHLKTLNVGVSPLYEFDVVQVTAALSLILPERRSLVYSNKIEPTDGQSWESVKNAIPYAQVMSQKSASEKNEYESRLRALELEADTRLRILEAENQRLRAQLDLASASELI